MQPKHLSGIFCFKVEILKYRGFLPYANFVSSADSITQILRNLLLEIFSRTCPLCDTDKFATIRHTVRIPTHIHTSDTKWFLLSVRNTAKVFPLTLGDHKPRDLIIVRIWRLSAFNSLSKTRADPHLATCANPLEAWPPYSHTLESNFGRYSTT